MHISENYHTKFLQMIWQYEQKTREILNRNSYLSVVFKPSKIQEARGGEEPFYHKSSKEKKIINNDKEYRNISFSTLIPPIAYEHTKLCSQT